MPELCTMKQVLALSGEWVTIRTRELVHEDDPRLPSKEQGYVRFNAEQPPPKPVKEVQPPKPPTEPTGEAAIESPGPLSPPCVAENAVELQVPASDELVSQAASTSVPNLEPREEIRKMSNEDDYNDNDYEDSYEEDGLEEEDDDRPRAITKQTLKEIDSMSPSELEELIDNIDAHEEWQDLREEARKRTSQWLTGIKKAEQAPRCQFLKANGTHCGSPAMKDTALCYFHGEARTQRASDEAAKLQEIPVLEDRLSLQLAITRLCAQLTTRSVDEKTGRVLIAALRLAQKNLGDSTTLYGS